MSFVNYATREIRTQVVFYGPRAVGLRENISYIYARTSGKEAPPTQTEPEAAKIINHVPMSLGEVSGFTTLVDLYTAPPGDERTAMRLQVLERVDGIIFVAASAPALLDATVATWELLRLDLAARGFARDRMPLVVQLEQRDVPGALSVEHVRAALGVSADVPFVEAIPGTGVGVFDALKVVMKTVLTEVKRGA